MNANDDYVRELIRIEGNFEATQNGAEDPAVDQILDAISKLSPAQQAALLSKVIGPERPISVGSSTVNADTVYQFNLVDPASIAEILEAVATRVGAVLSQEKKE